MHGELPFPELVERIAEGDSAAATEFVLRFQPVVLSHIRGFLLRAPQLYHLEPEDISQTVFAEILDHLIQRRDLFMPNEEAACKLLSRIARFRLLDETRRARSNRRSGDLIVNDIIEEIPDGSGTPSAKVRNRELYELIYRRLTEEEKELVDRRMGGESWATIAHALGGTPESVRKRFERLFSRLRDEFALDE